MSRIVTIKIKLDRLNLDQHARDKFLRLVGERYNKENDEVTIVTDRCPLKKQNYDYGVYLLTGKIVFTSRTLSILTVYLPQHFIMKVKPLKNGKIQKLKQTWKSTSGTITNPNKHPVTLSIGNKQPKLNHQLNMSTV